MAAERIPTRTLLAYAPLAIAMAFATLPIYMYVPKFYAEYTTLSLTYLGTVLLLTRLIDTVQDPLIGLLSDKYIHKRKLIMWCAVPFLAAGYVMLFAPPEALGKVAATSWLVVALVIVYTAYSILAINYYAQGVGLTEHYHQHSRVAAYREGTMLVGVLLAASLPQILQTFLDDRVSYIAFGLIFAVVLVLSAIPTLSIQADTRRVDGNIWKRMKTIYNKPNVRWILLLFFCNTVPTAITSTLFLFFVEDVINAPEWAGGLLVIFFASAAASLPFWLWYSHKTSKRQALYIAMPLAIAVFFWAFFLGEGDLIPFLLVSILSGFAIGADLSLLPSLYADQLRKQLEHSAAGFGAWNLVYKLNLAVAAGVVLPLLDGIGYDPKSETHTDVELTALSFTYALIPCGLKVVAIIVLWMSPIDKKEKTT